ncbi:MAG: J domain-containing protein [Coriobacteriales bacterium]|jgi:curved DNA-binding protein|nr:J domain-containing protein [Coriobacteriales bacterium]
MVAEKNYYQVMGVKEDASADEIKKAFKKLARKHHPDAGGDEARFKEISEAYEVISDKDKRAEYDTLRKYGAFGGARGGARGGGWRNVAMDFEDFGGIGDIFNRIRHGEGAFGTDWEFSQRGPKATKGKDQQVTLLVSFEEAFRGVEKAVTIRTGDGREQKIDVKVPAGAVEGGKLRYKGKGAQGTNGGARGDLVIVTSIKPHDLYSRDGADVYLSLPIGVAEAALGAQIVVPAPDGSMVKLRVPALTPDGKTFAIRGKGAPRVKGEGCGDLKVQVRYALPAQINEGQRAALEAFAAASDLAGADIRPRIAQETGVQAADVYEPQAAAEAQAPATAEREKQTADACEAKREAPTANVHEAQAAAEREAQAPATAERKAPPVPGVVTQAAAAWGAKVAPKATVSPDSERKKSSDDAA